MKVLDALPGLPESLFGAAFLPYPLQAIQTNHAKTPRVISSNESVSSSPYLWASISSAETDWTGLGPVRAQTYVTEGLCSWSGLRAGLAAPLDVTGMVEMPMGEFWVWSPFRAQSERCL